MIKNIRKSIDFALFTATPSSWDTSSSQQSKLGTYLQLCQDQINGMAIAPNKVDPNSQAKLKELKNKIKAKIAQLEKQKTSASNSEQKELNKRLKELKDSLRELEIIIASTVKYQFKVDKEPQFSFDGETNTGTIKYDGSIGSLLNELKHAYQFETNQIDFIKISDPNGVLTVVGGLTYDIHDEIATYKRQYAYDGVLKFNVEINNSDFSTNKVINLASLGKIEIKKMNRITASVIIKVSDGIAKQALYKHLPTKSLNTNSPIKDVVRGNKNRKGLISGLGIDSFDQKKPYIEFVKVYISSKPFIYVK